MPMPAADQQNSFCGMLGSAVGDECSIEVIKEVHGYISDTVAEHKESRSKEPLTVSRDEISDVLRSSGVDEERINDFKKSYDDTFGEKTLLNQKNLLDVKQFEVNMPDVSIRINPGRSGLVDTRVIDGVKYIVIRADESVEVNGVQININN